MSSGETSPAITVQGQIRVVDHGFDSVAFSFLGKKVRWMVEERVEEGTITFVGSFGVFAVRKAEGDSVCIR